MKEGLRPLRGISRWVPLVLASVVLASCGGSSEDTFPPVPATAQAVGTGQDPNSSSTVATDPAATTDQPDRASGSSTPLTASASSATVTTAVTAPTTSIAIPDELPLMNGMFISVVASVSSLAEAAAESAELEGIIWPELGILQGDEFESLDPGSWIVYAGPFNTASEAQDSCRFILNRRAGTNCVGRRVSQDPADRELHYPPAPAGSTTGTTSPSPTPDRVPSAEEIYRKIAPSVAYIVNGGNTGAGSGILIDGGYIVTNYHVVKPYQDVLWIVFPDGTELRNVPVAGSAPSADLAILGPVSVTAPPLSLNDGENMLPGSTVFLVGYPAEVAPFPEPSIAQGVLSRTYEERETGLTVLRTDAPTVGGQSGGAMVDGQGNVIGVTMRVVVDRGMSGLTEAYSAADYAALVDAMALDPVLPNTRRDDEPVPSGLEGTFISVVVSASSRTAVESALDDLEARFWWLPLGILISDDYASLNPGYWVVYVGPFYSPEEAQNACWFDLNMRSGALCYGRRLSQDPSDLDVVYPPSPDGSDF